MDAHQNMAANIEEMFQDFILNKIKEIEGQNGDGPGADKVDCVNKTDEPEDKSPTKDKSDNLICSESEKKQKESKTKDKEKNPEEENSSESGPEKESEAKHLPRCESQTSGKKEKGESKGHKHHSSAKKKKKKNKKRKKRTSGGNTTDSDSELVSKQSDCGKSLSHRQEELPDIIPKQECPDKRKGSEEKEGPKTSDSPSHSCSQSHSHSEKNSSHSGSSHQCQESSTPPQPTSQPDRTSSSADAGSSSDKKEDEDKSEQITKSPSKHLQEQEHNNGEERTQSSRTAEPQNPELREKPEEKKEKKEKTEKTEKKRRHRSKSPHKNQDEKASKRKKKRSKSPHRSYRRRSRSRSRSPSVRRRSLSRSVDRKRRRSRSRSVFRSRRRRSVDRKRRRSRSRSLSRSRRSRRSSYSQRDRWKREPSHSPVLILRKDRSPPRKRRSRSASPKRITEHDRNHLLEIAKANAAAMCVKAGMPIPASLQSTMNPYALPNISMNAAVAGMTAATVTAALSNMSTLASLMPNSSSGSKSSGTSNNAALEEAKKKFTKQANSISIKEFTDKCKMIADSAGELPTATPHISDDEEDEKPFGGAAIREQKVINFNINSAAVRPSVSVDTGKAKEFPVSSGSQHRKKEGEVMGAYGEWVPVDKATEKAPAASRKAVPAAATAVSSPPSDAAASAAVPEVKQPEVVTSDSVFPDTPLEPVDITQAVTERIKAQRRLAENPNDVNAICMLNRAQEQVDAWAQSSYVPGLFTGSTGAQVLSSEELSTSGPQAWLKKDQFLRAAPVSGGVGEFLMRKMGWRTGEGLGRNREGTVEPIVIDFKVDRKGLVAEGEKPQKQTGGLVITKDLMGKHPVSALIELCNKRRFAQPDFVLVHHSGPDHRKNFLFKVTVNGVDYQPQTASPNKKHAKAMAATVALQAYGEVRADGPGLYTGPVFTAASTGPLFST